MYKRKVPFLLFLLFMTASLALGIDQGFAQPKAPAGKGKASENQIDQVRKAAAAIRKSKGRMQYTTNDDRWAAAQRTADRRAAAAAKGKGGGK